MKKMEICQLEKITGGHQRTCFILGVGMVVGVVGAAVNASSLWLTLTSFGAAASLECF